MGAEILDGKAVAAAVRSDVTRDAATLTADGVIPGLAVVLVGDDPASAVYVRNKTRAARECGVNALDHKLSADTTERELLELVDRLNRDAKVHGILVQLPLPKHIDPRRVIDAIDPRKDVDGLHPVNAGLLASGTPGLVPCTPRGCMKLLQVAGVSLPGTRALVVGRSNLVGRPMALLLTAADATVTVAHSKTRDLADEVARAEVLVVAIGRARAIRGEWIREGAVVIDVGTNRTPDGKLVGDVDFEGALPRARAITPVPGGVGPMTIAMLLANTVDAASRSITRRASGG